MEAIIVENMIPILRAEDYFGETWLKINIPTYVVTPFDFTNKTLNYQGKFFTFMSLDLDNMTMNFRERK